MVVQQIHLVEISRIQTLRKPINPAIVDWTGISTVLWWPIYYLIYKKRKNIKHRFQESFPESDLCRISNSNLVLVLFLFGWKYKIMAEKGLLLSKCY